MEVVRGWRLSIDGRTVATVVHPSEWVVRASRAMVEGHGGPLPHVRITKVRARTTDGWTTSGLGYLSVQTAERPDWGRDWLRTY